MEQSGLPTRSVAEDAAEGGEAIDTFCTYRPSALPQCLIQSLLSTEESSVSHESSSSGPTSHALNCVPAKAGSPPPKNSAKVSSEGKNGAGYGTEHEYREVIDIISDSSRSSFEDERSRSAGSYSAESTTKKKGITISNTVIAPHDERGMENDEPPGSSHISRLTLRDVPSHSFPACESALLASVSAPRASDESARFLFELQKNKALSPLQLEGATLAISRHNRLLVDTTMLGNLPSNTFRAGFFIGDGAGVGKGRQIAAVLRDSMCRGRTRHLWISVSRELCEDATRDLRDVGCHCEVHDGSDLLDQTGGINGKRNAAKGLGVGAALGKGVLFVTYQLLVSGQGRRMEEIILWLSSDNTSVDTGRGTEDRKCLQQQQKINRVRAERGFSGLIVFDEAHKAKNLDADTQTARLVVELQRRLPHARVLYCSATGVSDIKHMAYATRLGLWGPGSSLYPNFDNFQRMLANRGVGSLEMLALEMKQMGAFVARTLSWEGAEFENTEIQLEPEQIVSYDCAVRWWFDVKREIEEALAFLKIQPPKTLWRAYWAAHQRFFKEMAICAKVPRVAKEAKRCLNKGYAVVIGLQSTGEASTQSALDELLEQHFLSKRNQSSKDDPSQILLPSLVSTAASIMTSFVRNHFPVSLPPPEPPRIPPIPSDGFADLRERVEYHRLLAEAERIKSLPPPPPIPLLLERRKIALEAVKKLVLPPNPLDDLIDQLGGADQVAEMTGRSGRIVRTSNKKHFRYARRTGTAAKSPSFGLSLQNVDDADRLNVVEKKKFMDGRKPVAIISDAASTGISLHAAEGSGAADRRRVHFTIELPWSADKAIQQLGRSHRSGQMSAPIYKMVVTDLGGERRFAAAVSKRMANLGALTKGDRRAATGSDLSEFDIDSTFGRRALKRVYSCLRDSTAPSRKSHIILDEYIKNAPSLGDIIKVRRQDAATQHSYALLVARQALNDVELRTEGTSETRKNSVDVKMFLNRICGLEVQRQNLVFSLFMSTLDDVIADSKATGEFEGSVEDVKATFIHLEGMPEELTTDRSSGAPTLLTKVVLDRGISFEAVIGMSVEGATQVNESINKEARVACSGFYISTRKISGRHLVLFAKRKVEPSSNENVYDPLGLMVITRPNTGRNPCEMSTKDLHIKYKLIVSSEDVGKTISAKPGATSNEFAEQRVGGLASAIRRKYPTLGKLWDDAYHESDCFEHYAGLAPRRSRIGLITGAVLHILPALEKAVVMRRQAERALKVIRVELSESGQRIVGVRFPLDDDATGMLKAILKDLHEARRQPSALHSFRDELFDPVDESAVAWATKERKTMKSYFCQPLPHSNHNESSVASTSTVSSLSGNKRKQSPVGEMVRITPSRHREDEQVKLVRNNPDGKTRPITSFFLKK